MTARGRRCCRVWSDHALPCPALTAPYKPPVPSRPVSKLRKSLWYSLVLPGTPSPHHQQHVQTGKGRIQTVFITRDLDSSKPLRTFPLLSLSSDLLPVRGCSSPCGGHSGGPAGEVKLHGRLRCRRVWGPRHAGPRQQRRPGSSDCQCLHCRH